MGNVLINEDTMTAIADSIRERNGSSAQMKPSAMPSAIENLPGRDLTISGFGSVIRSSDTECRDNIMVGSSPASNETSLSIGDYIIIHVSITGTEACRPSIVFESISSSSSGSELGVEYINQVSVTTNVDWSADPTKKHGTMGYCFLFKVIKNNPGNFGVVFNFTNADMKSVPTTYSYHSFYIKR